MKEWGEKLTKRFKISFLAEFAKTNMLTLELKRMARLLADAQSNHSKIISLRFLKT